MSDTLNESIGLVTTPDIYRVLGSYKELVDNELKSFFDNELKSLINADISAFGYKSLDLLREFSCRPAKRIRGALSCLVYDSINHSVGHKNGVRIAIAMELIQNYLLIIDDVMDLSIMRRGRATLHEIYKQRNYDDHAAKMMTINVGLLAQHLANMVIAGADSKSSLTVKALKLIHRNVELTGLGQLDDLSLANSKAEEKDIIRMYMLKSGYYTFVNPIQVGAVLAGADDEEFLKEIEEFGVNAGVAFQLRDDVLGLFGDPSQTGKPLADDIKEGKNTLLIENCLKNSSNKDAKFLQSKLGGNNLTAEEIIRVQKIITESGSLQHAEDTIYQYSQKAKAIVANSSFWDEKMKGHLIDLITLTADRNK